MTDVVHLLHRDARRHLGGEGLHLLHHGVGNIEGIAVRCLEHRHGDGVVVGGVNGGRCVVVEAVAHLPHVLEEQEIAGGGTPHDQVVELL